ncbi:hypothetical protein FA13DRAFT_1722678 [Coprinellus micaceus]|uniref:F-box domain-containing protein n=1 Tax=Coprinellus micaceus TaxID=71717 RepID=A0A4Y7RL02_COPMI|nr:hypothetical protein FA13DRAFT_1722678 [Coprinellus micaceus]
MGSGPSSPHAVESTLWHPMPGDMDTVRKIDDSSQIEFNDTQARDAATAALPPTSPVNQLPLEVLGQIFEASFAPGMSSECMRRLFNMCLVCRTWREAALVHHRLWSSLEVKTRFTPHVYDKVEAWFARAGTTPKSLVVRSPYHQYCWVEEGPICGFTAPGLLKQLLEGSRLDHLTLSCPTSHWFDKSSPWGNLRSLRLVVNTQWEMDSEPYEAVDQIFHRLPPVKSLHLHVPGYKYHIPPSSPRADQRRLVIPQSALIRLTSLTLDCDWHYDVVARILRPCANIQTLTIHLKSSSLGYSRYEFADDSTSEDGIILPKLKVLRLRQANPKALELLLRLETPTLAELDISFEVAGFAWRTAGCSAYHWEGYIGAYVSRSSCEFTLHRFRLHAVTISSSTLEELLPSYFPWLRVLTLDCVNFEDRGILPALKGLVRPGELCEALVPHLHTIDLIQPAIVYQPARWQTPPRSHIGMSLVRFLGDECDASQLDATVRLSVTQREDSRQSPQLEEEDSDWNSDDEFDSWDFNLGIRESILHTLEHDYI